MPVFAIPSRVAVPVIVSVDAPPIEVRPAFPVVVVVPVIQMPWAVEAVVRVGWLEKAELNSALTAADGTLVGSQLDEVLQLVEFPAAPPSHIDSVVSAYTIEPNSNTVAVGTKTRIAAIRRRRGSRVRCRRRPQSIRAIRDPPVFPQ